jgi:hypothetical protein
VSPKYVLCPGDVESKRDGQVHHINARQLASLYQVPMEQCVVRRSGLSEHEARMFDKAYGHLPELHPRYDGAYPCFKDNPP